MRNYLTQPLAFLILCIVSNLVMASSCHYTEETAIAFTAADSQDTLRITVDGDDCASAKMRLQVNTANHDLAYDYSLPLQEILPVALNGAELEAFIPIYIHRLLEESTHRSTENLPPYSTPEDYYQDTNDFVTIDPQAYEALRQLNHAIIWHTTGDSSWVHMVYDGKAGKSVVIMRGGVFTQ